MPAQVIISRNDSLPPCAASRSRWVSRVATDGWDKKLKRFIDGNRHRAAMDAVNAPTVLLEYTGEQRAMPENRPKAKFHALREQARLAFQQQRAG